MTGKVEAARARAIVRARLHCQRLAGPSSFTGPVEAVRGLVAVQAQELPEAKWALGQRTGCDEATVDRLLGDGALVRTHVPRPTWHLLARDDVRLVLRVLGPRVHVSNRFQYKQFGLDHDTVERTAELMQSILADGEPRTRTELASMLGAAGVPDMHGARLAHVLMHAEIDALVISGPRRGRQHTYQLLDQRIPRDNPATPAKELATLVLRWFVGHGPATRRDLAWWSGLPLASIEAGLAELSPDALATTHHDGKAWYSAPGAHTAAGSRCRARLLGTFDEAVIGYRDVRALTPDGPTHEVAARPVVVDGYTVGHWRRSFTAGRVRLGIELDRSLGARGRTEVEAEARRYARFFDRELELMFSDEPC